MISLGKIKEQDYSEYSQNVIFDAYKWDLKVGDQSTIGDCAILLENEEAEKLKEIAEKLYIETINMEAKLKNRVDLCKYIGISEQMSQALADCIYEPEKHIRLMRFDFHPTKSGWAVSEVNSDVPAGYPEATILPLLAEKLFPGYIRFGDFESVFVESFKNKIKKNSTIAYLYDTHVVEDYQILKFLGDCLEKHGYKSLYISPVNIKDIKVDAVYRYFPVEFLEHTLGVDWRAFLNNSISSCNHPIALLTQSKRLPLVWDELGVDHTMWSTMLPKSVCVTKAHKDKSYIFKPAFGRVGEGINVPNTISKDENEAIKSTALQNPTQWVAQKLFESQSFSGQHLCVGAFVIDGKFAGFYGRSSIKARMDFDASDVAVLAKGQCCKTPRSLKHSSR